MASQDDHIVALDAKTGKVAWDAVTDDVFKCRCTLTSAPLYLKGKVISGVAGGDGPFRGYINALGCENGQASLAFQHHSRARRARIRNMDRRFLENRRRSHMAAGLLRS